MRKRSYMIALLVVFTLFFVQVQHGNAQSLSFEVPRQNVTLFVNSDGTISLDYTITFNNLPGAAVIDIVDIGLPNDNYSLNSISAEIDGQPVDLIRPSEFVSPGVEIHLGANAIQPGRQGTLHVYIGVVERALGKSTLEEAEEYASIVFTPNHFDGDFVRGSTDMTVSIVLPAGMQPEEPRYHTPSNNWPGGEEPQSRFDDQGRVVYTWNAAEASSSAVYQFGASFPIRLVPATLVVATETPNLRFVDFESLFACLCPAGFVLFIVGTSILGAVSANKRRMQYLPPKIAVEGHGIKRGLTAVEAGVLMEQPLDKVMTMVLFSILKKGAAIVESREPLELKIADPLPVELLPYEISFLNAFKEKKAKARQVELQDVIISLVKSVSEKMKGFSRKESIEYYRGIMEKAWQQVTAANTPEIKSDVYEQVMDWTLLDQRWEGRTREVFETAGPVRVPTWWWRFDPVIRSSGGGLAASGAPIGLPAGQGGITLPKLPGADFAASMASGVQDFSSNVVGNLTSFTEGITNKTNPVPKSSSYSGGRSGGGCACACACAGCACACAGGGR